jgi:hypothetical protein
LAEGLLIETIMKDPQLNTLAGEVKKLAARVGALEESRSDFSGNSSLGQQA